MTKEEALGYLIKAARKAHFNIRQEEKLVECMREVMNDDPACDAFDTYRKWISYDEQEECSHELDKAVEELGKDVA